MDRNGQKAEIRSFHLPPSTFHLPSRGFTLIELMITVMIVGILASMAVPLYQKTMERAYWREAGDLLMTIYYGERAYYLKNTAYYTVAETAAASEWRKIFMEKPNVDSIPVKFKVDATSTTFTGTATRKGGPCDTETRTINEERTLSGTTCWCPSC